MKKLYKHFGLNFWDIYDSRIQLDFFFRGKYTTQVIDYTFFLWI